MKLKRMCGRDAHPMERSALSVGWNSAEPPNAGAAGWLPLISSLQKSARANAAHPAAGGPLFPSSSPHPRPASTYGVMVATKAESRKDSTSQKSPVHYPFWFGGSASCFAACVTHPLDLSELKLYLASDTLPYG